MEFACRHPSLATATNLTFSTFVPIHNNGKSFSLDKISELKRHKNAVAAWTPFTDPTVDTYSLQLDFWGGDEKERER